MNSDKPGRSLHAPRPVAVLLLQIALLGYIAMFCYGNSAVLSAGQLIKSSGEVGWQGYLHNFGLPLFSIVTFMGLCFRWRLAQWLVIGLGLWVIGSTVNTFSLFIASMGQIGGGVGEPDTGAIAADVLTMLVAAIWLYMVAFAANARRFFGLSE